MQKIYNIIFRIHKSLRQAELVGQEEGTLLYVYEYLAEKRGIKDIFADGSFYHYIQTEIKKPENDESGSAHVGISQATLKFNGEPIHFIPGWTDFGGESELVKKVLENFLKDIQKVL